MSKSETTAVFAERLTDLINDFDISYRDLEKCTGISASAISKYTNEGAQAPITTVAKLAKYFGVSADYLLGISDAKTSDKDIQAVCDYTGLSAEAIKNIRQLCIPNEDSFLSLLNNERFNENKWIINEFIASQTFNDIVDHISYLNFLNEDFLARLALYFGDYEFFDKLRPSFRNLAVEDFRRKFTMYDPNLMHGILCDEADLCEFKIQKSVLNYCDKLSIAKQLKDINAQMSFNLISILIHHALERDYDNHGITSSIEQEIKKYDLKEDSTHQKGVLILKELYEELKKLTIIFRETKGDTNADNNEA